MPHFIVEFADEPAVARRIEPLLDTVYQAAVASGLFDESHIRVRALAVGHYRVAGRAAPFIHVQCRIHGGRSEAQRRDLSEAVLAAIKALALPVEVVSVEVVEMERAGYAKWTADG